MTSIWKIEKRRKTTFFLLRRKIKACITMEYDIIILYARKKNCKLNFISLFLIS